MFNPTKSQIYFVLAIVIGLIVGKLIKNFKLGFGIAIVLGLMMAVGNAKKKKD